MALKNPSKEASYIQYLCKNLNIAIFLPKINNFNNTAAIFSTVEKTTQRSKHINLKVNYLSKQTSAQYVATSLNFAHLLTEVFTRDRQDKNV